LLLPAIGAAARANRAQRGESAVVLIALDGFRADYLDRYDAPNLRALAAHGVRARWMSPVFPSLTFPNLYTIVTGLYPAHHGIVNNTFVDPASGRPFRISDTLALRESRWFGGEPLWVTAEKQGVRAGTFFWVGSEAAIDGVRPTFWKAFDNAFPKAARVDTALAWLTREDSLRPRFVTLYFSDVDRAGHTYGPDAPETRAAVLAVDSAIGWLRAGIARLGLADRVNVIVVADHGMAPLSPERTLVLEDYIDTASVTIVSTGEVIGLNPRDGDRARLVAALRRVPHLEVYDKDSVPARWHYGANPRIPAVVGAMEEGWELVSRRVAAQRQSGERPFRGSHGYDDQAPLMRALFVAEGPAFRQGAIVEPFRNIHVYDLVCGILGLTPAPNDGSPDSTRAMLKAGNRQ
jgi:predicted AlkP superfamily pyrophosphatase or phosphodiesterase